MLKDLCMAHLPEPELDIGISSLVWNANDLGLALQILRNHNITSIDITPWEYLGQNWLLEDAVKLVAYIKSYQLNVVGMQGLYYGIGQANIFDLNRGRTEFIKRSIECIRLANIFGARFLVAGAPATRQLRNCISLNDAKEAYAEVIAKMLPTLEQANVIYCIEPVSVRYGEELVTSSKIAFEICTIINSPFVRVNFDSGFSTSEDYGYIINCKEYIGHGHFSTFDHKLIDMECLSRFGLIGIAKHWSIEVNKTGSLEDLVFLCRLVNKFKNENSIFADCRST